MGQDHWFFKVNGETELLDPYHMYDHQHSTHSHYCSCKYKIQLYSHTSVHSHGVDMNTHQYLFNKPHVFVTWCIFLSEIPLQVCPSAFKLYPSLQLQLYERKVFVQTCSQPPLSVSHSSTKESDSIVDNMLES